MPMDASTLARLRRFIAEPDETTYTDDTLNAMYDNVNGDINVVAADVWQEKAAKAAVLVDTSEGASSRKNSQVYSNAVKMSEFYGGGATSAAAPDRSARTRAIVRP